MILFLRNPAMRAARTGLLLWLAAACWPAWSNETAVRIDVDTSALGALGEELREENPYRGNRKAIEIGAAAFDAACARCHVLDSSGGIGPDLRILNNACKRISDASRQQACLRDQDHYFLKTVREGKVIVGVTHMPAWRDFLSQEAIWAIRSYIESRPR